MFNTSTYRFFEFINWHEWNCAK